MRRSAGNRRMLPGADGSRWHCSRLDDRDGGIHPGAAGPVLARPRFLRRASRRPVDASRKSNRRAARREIGARIGGVWRGTSDRKRRIEPAAGRGFLLRLLILTLRKWHTKWSRVSGSSTSRRMARTRISALRTTIGTCGSATMFRWTLKVNMGAGEGRFRLRDVQVTELRSADGRGARGRGFDRRAETKI